jgi:hypothetical protein
MQRIRIGDHVRINGLQVSQFWGRVGVVAEVERDPKHRNEWDMCAVVIESRHTRYFPAFALDSIDDDQTSSQAA